jgi:hypothetical protein
MVAGSRATVRRTLTPMVLRRAGKKQETTAAPGTPPMFARTWE